MVGVIGSGGIERESGGNVQYEWWQCQCRYLTFAVTLCKCLNDAILVDAVDVDSQWTRIRMRQEEQ